MKTDLFDSGYFRIIVPAGWMAFFGIDSECRTTQKKVHIFKEAKHDGCVFQVMILTKNGEYELSLADADVQTILTSLTQTN